MILPTVLVLASLIFGVSSFQDAYAVVDCDDPVLEAMALYAGSEVSTLNKVDASTGPPVQTCLIGEIRVIPGSAGSFITCEDIAIDHSDSVDPAPSDPDGHAFPNVTQLYCISTGNLLHKMDRIANFDGTTGNAVDAGTGDIVDASVGLSLLDGGAGIPNANALEIDLYGNAYLAAGGKFYDVNLSTGAVTLRTDFNSYVAGADPFESSGDLARDENTSFDIYWTVECDGMTGGAEGLDPICPNHDSVLPGLDLRDRLYRIQLDQGPNLGTDDKDLLIPLAELPTGSVFGFDIIQPNFNICYITTATPEGDNGFLFETDRNGAVTRTLESFAQNLNSFGATGNPVGGTLIMINAMSLAIAAAGINSPWLLVFAVSGAAVIAYQFTGKSKKRKKFEV